MFSLICCLYASKSNPGCYTVVYTNSECIGMTLSAILNILHINSPIFTAQMMNRLVWFTHILHSDMHCIFHTVRQSDLVWMLSLKTELQICSMCIHRIKHMSDGEEDLRNVCGPFEMPCGSWPWLVSWSTKAGSRTCWRMVTVFRLRWANG